MNIINNVISIVSKIVFFWEVVWNITNYTKGCSFDYFEIYSNSLFICRTNFFQIFANYDLNCFYQILTNKWYTMIRTKGKWQCFLDLIKYFLNRWKKIGNLFIERPIWNEFLLLLRLFLLLSLIIGFRIFLWNFSKNPTS